MIHPRETPSYSVAGSRPDHFSPRGRHPLLSRFLSRDWARRACEVRRSRAVVRAARTPCAPRSPVATHHLLLPVAPRLISWAASRLRWPGRVSPGTQSRWRLQAAVRTRRDGSPMLLKLRRGRRVDAEQPEMTQRGERSTRRELHTDAWSMWNQRTRQSGRGHARQGG